MFWRGRLAVRECPRFRRQVSRRMPLRHTFLSRESEKAKRKRKGGSGTDYAIRTHWAAKRTRYAATSKMAKSMSHLRGVGYLERAPFRRGGFCSLGGIAGGHPPPRWDWGPPWCLRPCHAP